MRTRTADCGQEKLRTFTCGLAQIFDSSPQFLHRVAVRSPHMGMESADTSPQFILSGPHFQSLHVRKGKSPQFLLSAVRGPRPHFILALYCNVCRSLVPQEASDFSELFFLS
ncbi:hypothetical protein OUZ56_015980 [Daphnia magna]|uniref:Uncharacterized protein n=1 Tax=Daphnia magna TaxID=35525 RepID=A0ABR0APB1_9CRUS|nr:hypothetical protein OUZ56_015980 [Daphnia magna]